MPGTVRWNLNPQGDNIILRKIKSNNTEIQYAKIIAERISFKREDSYGRVVNDSNIVEGGHIAYPKGIGYHFEYSGVKYVCITRSQILFQPTLNEIEYDNT